MTSLNSDATALMARIRAHWGIENRLHWVKDVVLQGRCCFDATSGTRQSDGNFTQLDGELIVPHGYPSIVKAIDLLSHAFDRLLPLLGIFPL